MKLINDKLYVPDADKYFSYGYERGATARAMSICRKDGVFLDIGTHVGLWAMRMSKHFNKGYAVEAVSEHFNCLNANLEKYSIENIETYNLGVSSVSGVTAEIVVMTENSGRSSLVLKPRKEHKVEKINLHKMDDLFSDILDQVAFIKMDIEGHELEGIRGAEKLIKASKPDIFIEVIAREKSAKENALDLLASWGYKMMYVQNRDNSFWRHESYITD